MFLLKVKCNICMLNFKKIKQTSKKSQAKMVVGALG